VSDNRLGAITVVDHLRSFGHRRIAYLGDSLAIATAAQRFEGYQHALERAGLEDDPRIIRHGLRSTEAATQATIDLIGLPDPPTALFAAQNLITIGTVKALRQAGVQDRIALVGFDDFVLADVLVPGITVITQDVARLGRLAAQLLFARLDGDDSPPRTHIVPASLVVRGSGEIRPVARIAASG
jgi:LacI family transcriptional regulator